MAKVFVSSVPAEFKELVELYAENESKGGRMLNYEYDSTKQCSSIDFLEESDAKHFLARKSLEILSHEMPILEAPGECTIFVYDVPINFKDDLDCILESPRKGGGPITSFDFMEELNCARVTFEEKRVAKHFVDQGSLKIGSEKLIISFLPPDIYRPKFKFYLASEIIKKVPISKGVEETSCSSAVDSAPPETFHNKEDLIVEAISCQDKEGSVVLRAMNLSSILNEGYLRMALESKRFGGGAVKFYKFIEKERCAYFSFHNDETAFAMLSKGKISLDKNNSFQVERANFFEEDLGIKENNPGKSTSQSGNKESHVVGLKIEGQTNESAVVLYAENKRSQGGPLRSTTEIKPSIFVLNFMNAKDAKSFCDMDHSNYFKAKTHTVMLEPWPENARPCAIYVEGCSNIDMLKLFFENPRSGGRPDSVDNVVVIQNNFVCITFNDPTAVQSIVAERKWKLGEQELKVTICSPACPPPLLDPNVKVEPFWLRFTQMKLSSLNTKEFREYVSLAAQSDVVEISFNKECCAALVRFNDIPNYKHVLETLCSRPFSGIMISVERVPVADSIIVTSPKYSLDLLKLYFENPRSGGGRVKGIKHFGMGDVIIQFEDSTVVNNVAKKSHKLDGNTHLTVKIYRESSFSFV